MVTRAVTVLGACLIACGCTAGGNDADPVRGGVVDGAAGTGAGADTAGADAQSLADAAPPRILDDAGMAFDDKSCTPSSEVCDALDNDCDGALDEGLASFCKTERCPAETLCPDTMACDPANGRCVPATACEDAVPGDLPCDAPLESWWQPSPCNPQACARWQDGTCWANCRCTDDGIFRWDVGCTE